MWTPTKYTVRTNRNRRPVIYWHDLTPREREQLDYVSADDRQSWTGFRYHGEVYDLGEFEAAPPSVQYAGFSAIQVEVDTESAFSAIAINLDSSDMLTVAHISW